MEDVKFTFEGYKELIEVLLHNGYQSCGYDDWDGALLPVILRHDIDQDMRKAVELAEFENKLGVKSTYFVLLSTDLYNIASRDNVARANKIIEMGHRIGLHFDEKAYPNIYGNPQSVVSQILKESALLSEILNYKIEVVSYHRPSKEILNANLSIPGIINSYSDDFFKDFKYLSDSRGRWREPVLDIIKSKKYSKLHILTHAIWYNQKEMSTSETLRSFINSGNKQRWMFMNENITDLNSLMPMEEIK